MIMGVLEINIVAVAVVFVVVDVATTVTDIVTLVVSKDLAIFCLLVTWIDNGGRRIRWNRHRLS